jgi:hypothetical protein
MTANYSYFAVTDVRNLIWEELKNYGILDEQDYYADGFSYPLIPIIPSQQVPEFNNLLPGKTYITYDVVQKNYGVQWWVSQEDMIMQIISRNNSQIMTISNFLTDLFRRYEKTAVDINAQIPDSSPFKFLYFKLESANPIQPFEDEGGFMSGDFVINYSYTRQVDEGTVANTGRFL